MTVSNAQTPAEYFFDYPLRMPEARDRVRLGPSETSDFSRRRISRHAFKRRAGPESRFKSPEWKRPLDWQGLPHMCCTFCQLRARLLRCRTQSFYVLWITRRNSLLVTLILMQEILEAHKEGG